MADAYRGGGWQWRAQGGADPQQARCGDGLHASDGRRPEAAGGESSQTMRKILALLALVLLAPLPALAADIQNLDLGKNAQVWFAEDHTVPIVAVVAALPGGSAYDPGAKPGLAAFATALMDEG